MNNIKKIYQTSNIMKHIRIYKIPKSKEPKKLEEKQEEKQEEKNSKEKVLKFKGHTLVVNKLFFH